MKIARQTRSFVLISSAIAVAFVVAAAWFMPGIQTASASDLIGRDEKRPDAPQAFGLQQKLVDPTRENDARLGSSVVIGPDFALVGTPLDDVGANQNQGSVLYYTRTGSTWTFQQRITASDGTAGDSFGQRMALSGDTLVVGLPVDTVGANGSQGSVYVFTRSGNVWTEQQKLTAADGASGDQLGGEVSIDGDTLIAGAQNNDATAGGDQGAAYVFTRSGVTWTQQQKLTAADGFTLDHFGEHVGISGDTAVIGVPDADIGTLPTIVDQGSAYIFVRSGGVWSQQQKILGPASDTGFAATVAIDGETVALANTNYTDAGSPDFSQGAVYVFTRTAAVWSEQQRLTASDRYFNDRFGNSIDLSGDKIVVGASLANIGAVWDQGAAYVFSRTAGVWTEQKKLFAPDGETSDQFGHSVAISGQDVIAGALFESSTGGTNSYGAAYVFADAFATSPAGCAWTNDVQYPINIRNQGAAVQGTSIFSFGGLSNNVVMANAYKFDGDRWTAIAPLPVALWGTAVASDGTYLYIAGGLNAANTTVNTLYRYDPVLNTYSNMQNAPSATWVSSAAFVNGKIYKVGGLTTSVGGAVNTVSAYDIAGNTWSAAANYPGGALGWIATAVDGGFIYSAGGTDGNISLSLKAYRYDPVGNTWNDAAVSDLPSANNSLAMGFLNGSLVVAGGATPDVLRLDPTTNTWGGGTSLLPNVYRSRQHLAGVVLGNEFHIIGGVTSGFNGTREHFKLVCGNALAPPTSCGIATSYTGSAVAIPDNNAAGVDIPITVSGIGTVTDLDFRFDGTPNGAATLQGVEHTNVGQLVFTLRSPMGTSLTFINRMSRTTAVGGCDNNHFSQVLLNDDAILPIDLQCSENSTVRPGTYSPGDKFSVFNGEPADGIWTLNVSDNVSGTTGNVRRFSLLFGACSTAAGVQISGRVLTAEGRGVRGARVSLVETNGVTRNVLTGSRGNYIFDDVEPGKTYIISAASRRFNFTPQVIQITDDLTNVDLVAQGAASNEKEKPADRKR
ncbi:MAG: kelch repeat-containing protein [Pyrinomonadaceae bacterium]